jgi:DNA-binding NtrC family response regulator
MQIAKLLIVDDNTSLLASLARALKREFAILTATDATTARKLFTEQPDIVILDIRLNEQDTQDKTGIELLREFLRAERSVPVIMFSAYSDVETAVECMRLGAVDFLPKSAGINELRQRLKRALENAHLSRQVTQLEERLRQLDPIELIGSSLAVAEIKEQTQMVARDGYVTVLIRGETGTGKELVARAIHRIGWRAREPFVPVAIATLNPNLIETELFGHEAGAFTGAKERRIGFVEKAKRGVLFLDEIGDLPADAQLKLLRFLEERKFSRVGSTEEIEVDVQIVAATNRDLEDAVQQGKIRKDLYFRLKSLQIFLPTLSHRLDDVPLLADHFLTLFRQQGRTKISELDPGTLEKLMSYSWPGNVRELKAVLERAIIYASFKGRQRLEKEDLPLEVLNTAASDFQRLVESKLREGGVDIERELARLELSYIEQALRLTEERKTEAWKLLGLNDRFALLRRAKSLLRSFPAIASEFPLVQKLYG